MILRNYIAPFVLAAGLHGLVVFALVLNWQSTEAIETIKTKDYLYIDAVAIAENPHTVRKRREKERERQVREQARKEEQEHKRLAEIRAEQELKKKQQELEDLRQVREQEETALLLQAIDREQAEEQALAVRESDRLKMEQSLNLQVVDEQQYRRAITDDEKSLVYVYKIQRQIVQNWSRPPSARNGMEALLKVFLVPTGEVVNVTVVESSGNGAFDRSAVLAVQKVQRFQVPNNSRQFERNFREFTVLFRPEDLRL